MDFLRSIGKKKSKGPAVSEPPPTKDEDVQIEEPTTNQDIEEGVSPTPVSPTFKDQQNIDTVHDAGPKVSNAANFADGIEYGSVNMSPEEIIKEVGSADLCDIFRKILENGIIVKCHTEFKVKDLKLWMKEGEHELRYKTINTKLMHVAHRIEIDKILFVQKGKRTKAHMLSPKGADTDEENCLSLLWRGGSLDLECDNPTICDALVKGFNLLITGEPVLYDEDEEKDDSDLEEAYDKIKEEFDPTEDALDEDDINADEIENLLRHFIEALKIGVDVVTHNREYSRDARLWIGDKRDRLWWKSKKATAMAHSCSIEDILLIEEGKKTTAFLNSRGQKAEEDDCFSLLMVGGKTLNLEVEDKVVKKALFEGFKLLIKAAKDGTLMLITATPAGESLVQKDES